MSKYKGWFYLLLISILLAACNLPGDVDVSSPPVQHEEQPLLEVDAKALRLPDRVIYSIRILNLGDTQISNISVRLETSTEDAPLEVLNNFHNATEVGPAKTVAWKLDAVPVNNLIGPLAAEASGKDQGSAEVIVGWESPSIGEMIIPVSEIDNASQTSATVEMVSVSMNDLPGSGYVYGFKYQSKIFMPVNQSTSKTKHDSLFTDIPNMGIRYYVPVGEPRKVTVERSAISDFENLVKDQVPIAAYQILKEKPGSIILVVPLDMPMLPYSLVRIFADSGEGFYEEAMLGTVTGDGLHAVFSADHNTQYVLTVSESISTRNRLDLSDFFYEDMIDSISGSIDEIMDMLSNPIIGELYNFAITGLGSQYDNIGSQYGPASEWQGPLQFKAISLWAIFSDINLIDVDGDGLDGYGETAAGTNEHNPDTDGDGHSDGDEVNAGSNPLDENDVPEEEEDDGIWDGPGCGGFICFRNMQREEESSGSGGSGGPNLSGGAGFGIMDLSERGIVFDISISAADLIDLASLAAAAEAFGEGWDDPDTAIHSGVVLRTIIVVGSNRFGLIIPGGQAVRPFFGLTPYLRSIGYTEEQVETESVGVKPTDTSRPSSVQPTATTPPKKITPVPKKKAKENTPVPTLPNLK